MTHLLGIKTEPEPKARPSDDVALACRADGAARRSVDRRTLLLSAAGAPSA
jgi:hypothetical protein